MQLLTFRSLSSNWEKRKYVVLYYIDIFQGISRVYFQFQITLVMWFRILFNSQCWQTCNVIICWHQPNLCRCHHPMTNFSMSQWEFTWQAAHVSANKCIGFARYMEYVLIAIPPDCGYSHLLQNRVKKHFKIRSQTPLIVSYINQFFFSMLCKYHLLFCMPSIFSHVIRNDGFICFEQNKLVMKNKTPVKTAFVKHRLFKFDIS